jgi:trypsin-like peptidase
MLHIAALVLLAGIAQAPPAPDAGGLAPPWCDLASKVSGPGDPLLGHLKGTAAFRCSGAFVTLEGRSKSARGLILTSGHCIGRGGARIRGVVQPGPGEVFLHVAQRRGFSLETGNAAAPRACAGADELMYATVTDVDVAIYRLAETYEEVERRTGARPLTVATDASMPAGARVRLPTAWHQRNYPCATDGTVPWLREGPWTWKQVLRLTKDCDAPGGSSGSPIVREDTGQVVAVFGTGYDDDGPPCSAMNPCEVDEKGAVSVPYKGRPYAHFVHWLHTCFDVRGDLDLTAAGCPLPRPRELESTER